ncbi:unnamed protein product [Closterium sp. NIES-54]
MCHAALQLLALSAPRTSRPAAAHASCSAAPRARCSAATRTVCPPHPARRALLQPARRALLPCASRPAAASASRTTALRVTPCCSQRVAPYCSQRVALCCPAHRALLQPARRALLQPARRALLPRVSRLAAASASRRTAALRVTPCCIAQRAPCCPAHGAPCPAARGAPCSAKPRHPARAALPNPSRATLPRLSAPLSRLATTIVAAAAARATPAAGGGAAGSAGSAAGAGGAEPTTDRHCLSWPLSRQFQRLGVDSGGHCLSRTTPPISSFASGFFSEPVQVVEALVFYVLHRGRSRAAALGASESAAALGASESTAALGASASAAALGARATPAPGPSSAEALHTFTLHSGASRCFFHDCTTLTPLAASVPVSLADPTGGPVVARASIVLPCPAVPSGSLSGLHLPTFSTNLVSNAAIQNIWVDTFTHGGQRVAICTCSRTGCHLAAFTQRPGSSRYTLTTASTQVAEACQVAVSSQVSASGQLAVSCLCRLLSHQTLLWHHRLGHPSLPRLCSMHSRLLVSGLPRSLPSLPHSPAPPRRSSLLRVSSDHYSSADSPHGRFRARPPSVEQARSATSCWGGEFSSDLLAEFCRDEGIHQSFTLPASPQQNGIAERRIGLIMDVPCTSMIHAAAPHFLWLFAVRYAAHQLNLWPRVSEPETLPTLRWTGKVGDALVFRVWGALSLVRDAKASKLSSRTLRCVFLAFPTIAPSWQFYHPRERRFFSSRDITFDESVYLYKLHPHASHPVPLAPLFLVPVPPPVDPLPPLGHAHSGVSQVDSPPLVEPLDISSDSSGLAEGGDPAAEDTAATCRSPRLETPPGFLSWPSSPPPQPGAVESGAETVGAEPGGAEIEREGSGGAATGGSGSGGAATGGACSWGAASGGADSGGLASPSGGGAVGDPAGGPGAGQPPQPDLLEMLLPQAIHAWIVRRGSPGGGGYGPAGAGAASPGGTADAGGTAGGAGGASGAGGTRGAGGAGPTNHGGTAGAGGAGGAAVAGGAGAGGTRGAGAAGPGGAGAVGAGGTVRAGGATRAAGCGGAGGTAGAGGARAAGADGTAGAGGVGGATGAAGTRGAGGTAGAGGAGERGTGRTGATGAAGPGGAHTRGAGAVGAGGAAGVGGAGGATGATATGGTGGTIGARARGATGAGGAAGAGGAGAGGTGGAGAAGPGGARTGGARATGAGGAVCAGGATGAAGSGGTGGTVGTGDTGGTAGAGGAGGATRAAGTRGAGAAGAGGAGAAGSAPRRLFFYLQPQSSLPPPDSVLCQVLILSSSTGLTPPLLCSQTDQSPPQLLHGSLLPAPTPHTEVTESLTERREPETRASTPVRARSVARPRPPAVPGTHCMALRPSSIPQRVVLPEPPASSLPHVPDPDSDLACAAGPTVTRLLATVITNPNLESTTAFAIVTELVDFAVRSRLDYVTSLVTESESVCPPSVRGEPALSSDVLEDRQFDLECLAAALPRFASMLLCPEGDPDALDIPTPRSYAEAITGEYSSQWQTAMDTEMASWKSTGTYVDEVPPPGANIAPGEWHGTTLSPFYVLVYVADLVFATADTEALALVLQRFGFQFSSPQPSPLSTGHSLSAPPSDESVEPRSPYPELVDCLITSGMGLVLGGQGSVVLTGHSDAFYADDQATQRSSQGYTFILGSGSVSWRSTRSSSVLGSSCEAEIYAGAMAA